MLYHNISTATEQNKHRFRCSEKPSQACDGWYYFTAKPLIDNAETAGDVRRYVKPWLRRKKRGKNVMRGLLVNPVSAEQETV